MHYFDDDEADDRACHLREESEGDRSIEILTLCAQLGDVFMFEAAYANMYIFSW